jgi:hypothetical protein
MGNGEWEVGNKRQSNSACDSPFQIPHSPFPRVAFDEFTSVVDRNVARIGSAAVAKAIRAGQIRRRFVAVTCHYDVLEWLEPDWMIDMATREFVEFTNNAPISRLAAGPTARSPRHPMRSSECGVNADPHSALQDSNSHVASSGPLAQPLSEPSSPLHPFTSSPVHLFTRSRSPEASSAAGNQARNPPLPPQRLAPVCASSLSERRAEQERALLCCDVEY